MLKELDCDFSLKHKITTSGCYRLRQVTGSKWLGRAVDVRLQLNKIGLRLKYIGNLEG